MADHRPNASQNASPIPCLLPLLMVTQTFGWGVNLSLLAIIAAPAGHDLGLSPGTIYAGATAFFLAAAAVAPAVGRRVDRHGGTAVMVWGAAIATVALVLLAAAQGAVSYFLAWAAQGVAMHAALSTATFGMLSQLRGGVELRRSFSLLMLATGLCATIMWPVSTLVMDALGWRGMCLAYAAAMLLGVLPTNLWLHRRATGGEGATETPVPDPDPLLQVGVPGAFRWVALFQTIVVTVRTSVMLMLIDIFVLFGTGRDEAVLAASLSGIALIVSRAIEVAGGSRLPPLRLAIGVVLAMCASFLPMLAWSFTGLPLPFWLAALTAVSYGLPAGLIAVLLPSIPQQVFGAGVYGRYIGRLARPSDLANAAAPAVLAALLHVSVRATVVLFILLLLASLLAVHRLDRLIGDDGRPARS